MPIIRVEMFTGRDEETKRRMVKEMTDAFIKTAGGKAEQVHVVITDVDKVNWAVGGELCEDRISDQRGRQ